MWGLPLPGGNASLRNESLLGSDPRIFRYLLCGLEMFIVMHGRRSSLSIRDSLHCHRPPKGDLKGGIRKKGHFLVTLILTQKWLRSDLLAAILWSDPPSQKMPVGWASSRGWKPELASKEYPLQRGPIPSDTTAASQIAPF